MRFPRASWSANLQHLERRRKVRSSPAARFDGAQHAGSVDVLAGLVALIFVFVAAPAWCFPILSFDTVMNVQPDSSVTVVDKIKADFTGDPHHGIYRDIHLTGRDRWGNNYRIRAEDVTVTDEAGNPLQTAKSLKSGSVHLRIGSPDVMLSDVRTYVIRYKLWRAIHFFSDHDELYWNPIGAEWQAQINTASCIVTLPKDVPSIQTASYTGFSGNTSTDAMSDTPNKHTARFWMRKPLSPGEGMTIVVGWPKGIVAPPTFGQEATWFISDNSYFFLPPLFLLGLVLMWRKRGADPDTGRSEVVAYDPPDGLIPAEMGTLIDERVDMRDISASIVDLAVRGFIRIKATTEKGLLSSKTDYTLELTRKYEAVANDPKLTSFEVTLVEGLFGGDQVCILSDLANKFYTHLPGLKSSLYTSMIKHGYFTHSPDQIRSSYRFAGFAVIGLGGFACSASLAMDNVLIPVGWGVAIALCGVMLALGARTMPRKTAKGKDALLAIRGFEEYLSRAERKEIEFQERNDYFEKFLPYAMALGIASKWARAFEGLQTTPPSWYSGGDGAFHPVIFVNDLNYASSSWGSTMTSTPRSSGSGGGSSFFGGGSGFSGGSSGGGGGGGGGGGW